MIAVLNEITQHRKLVHDAASALSLFDHVRNGPVFCNRAADDPMNQFLLQESCTHASAVISKVRESDWYLGDREVCKTLEDPKGDFKWPSGTGKATIKALKQCQEDGGLAYETFGSVNGCGGKRNRW